MKHDVPERLALLQMLRVNKEELVAPHLPERIAMANETVEKVRGTSSIEEALESLHLLYELQYQFATAWVEHTEPMPPGSREFLFDFDRPDDRAEVERVYDRIKAGMKYFEGHPLP